MSDNPENCTVELEINTDHLATALDYGMSPVTLMIVDDDDSSRIVMYFAATTPRIDERIHYNGVYYLVDCVTHTLHNPTGEATDFLASLPVVQVHALED